MTVGSGALLLTAGGAVAGGVLVATRRSAAAAGATGGRGGVVGVARTAVSAVVDAVRAVLRSSPGDTAASDRTSAESTADTLPAGAAGFVPALEGMRALAAVGVLTTHVAFVTVTSTGSTINRLYGRLDLTVAVFFALSGFLLWRAHARHARQDRPGTARPAGEYLRSRVVRIMPAYLALVVAAMLLLPQNRDNGLVSWITNLTLTQIYQPAFLVAGLTHAWSLAVEMAFYLALPLFWVAMKPLRGPAARWRIPALSAFGLAGLLYPLVPWNAVGLLPHGVNEQIMPPAFASWFAAGMILAELATAPPGRLVAWCRPRLARWGWWAAAAVTLYATTVPRWFSEGFVHPGAVEFSARTLLGTLVALFILAPVVLAPRGMRFPLLQSEIGQALGRWSYGIFLWHLLILHFAMELLRVPLWSGQMALVWPVTVAGSIAAAAASYSFVEVPAGRLLERGRV